MFLSSPLLGWRQRGWRWEALQRGRRRWVHIEYPPRKRSPLKKLHDSHDKLVFVCQGYIDRLSVDKLPPALQQRLKELRASPVPLYDGRLPWSQDVQRAIQRTVVPCLAFATGRTHHLLEAFTMDEVLALEKLIPEIRQAFAEMQKRLPEDESIAEKTRHRPLDLT
ncbi:Chromosome I, complete genome, related [Eimeria tenella]|uniref:Chromosome I, complete genome, related n=1 Tax=Eimeria tenella TaxID=5802 RepID=U6KRT8_EIMTE|nr:Chromosome I, complete genome, related [Eimeria tenella]CDJ39633.1 Chromosome I, complete genome, related [Eimeria tenella]|eukprot:XP_013230388.1 Chromosome I, complete genome, related [Eimeria tenella]